jgi:voltage-gated potassium channel
VVVTVYYLAPLTGVIDSDAILRLGVGLLIYLGVLVWQIRAIVSSAHPALRATEAVATALPLLLALFASAYLLMANNQASAFSEPLNRTGSLYFTMTVFSTVGFGDIVPKTDAARIATMLQMLVDLAVIGIVGRLLIRAVQVGQQRRSTGRSAG